MKRICDVVQAVRPPYNASLSKSLAGRQRGRTPSEAKTPICLYGVSSARYNAILWQIR